MATGKLKFRDHCKVLNGFPPITSEAAIADCTSCVQYEKGCEIINKFNELRKELDLNECFSQEAIQIMRIITSVCGNWKNKNYAENV